MQVQDNRSGYNRFLLLVAGLGGLLYGVDVGIIGGALPYLEATSGLNAGQLSIIVAAVLLGSVISTLFAGALADWMGRKLLMTLSGVLFVISIPLIALSHGYGPLILGRLLQGISAGLIGVVVPLYLAECLAASNRGKGTGIFQWLLTLGITTAAMVGMYFSIRVDEVAKLGDAALDAGPVKPETGARVQDHRRLQAQIDTASRPDYLGPPVVEPTPTPDADQTPPPKPGMRKSSNTAAIGW